MTKLRKGNVALVVFVLQIPYPHSARPAEDIRSKVARLSAPSWHAYQIDPDESFYGVPFGASEEDFMKIHGKPDGYIRLGAGRAAMIYGRVQAVVFENGKLVGIRISNQIVDWKLANEGQGWSASDNPDWRLNNGIIMGMSRKEVRKLLGDRLLEDELHNDYYLTTKARVELDFAQFSGRGTGDEAYELIGIYVRHGAFGGNGKGLGGFGGRLPGGGNESFGGIGPMLHQDDASGELRIIGITAGSPSAKAGLKIGQIIRSIDRTPTQGISLKAAVESLRGELGTKVRVELFDPSTEQSIVVELTREQIVTTGNTHASGEPSTIVTTDQTLWLEATNGARAVIQFLGFTSGGVGTGELESTATYRWRFKASPAAAVQAGTNTAVDRYTSTLTGSSRYLITPINNREEAKVKAGEISVDWSYGYTNKGYIRVNGTKLTSQVREQGEFEVGP